ncbi:MULTISPECIES: MerR family transcriptional regulator [Leuconostoc]|uniref:MerR family transcriptional regulator n=1 Tax=Bacilli TaxID=91061 RepID=UPI00068282D5|nr:MerR family transcriptional regulator [Leuconostoc mesenteroides]ARR89826.1 MerR family transcriptional regulator [Leuconostoc mesenteroides subsp. mesenteroides]MCT4390922.1 MerR family transcriptional regulator [Leuconostoc falkenbergense]MBZ1503716.1 MerR family transcriptional regulator [Leuconostoc mesenteroides]MCT3049701.1 MerR family transcriptional regulator [Leuconostoc mesenteroides]TLP97096.1 MerR family transcriptional regulator [Leuconostoc mesenteroides]
MKKAVQITGLTADTIRYYERIGIIGSVPRLENGIRDFDDRSINQLHFAKVMRTAGMSIEALKQYIDFIYEDDDATIPARKAMLIDAADEIDEKINSLVTARDYLRYKVKNYYGHMRDTEQKLVDDK